MRQSQIQYGHVARAAASEDHSRALRASTDRLPVDWHRPRGRPRQSWLRTIDSDLKPLNLGLHSALQRATDRPSWRRIVETAMLFERATRWWWWWWWWCQSQHQPKSDDRQPFADWTLDLMLDGLRRGQSVHHRKPDERLWLHLHPFYELSEINRTTSVHLRYEQLHMVNKCTIV